MVKEWFGQTIIHSDKRFSYEEAQGVLDNNSGELLTELGLAMELARKPSKWKYPFLWPPYQARLPDGHNERHRQYEHQVQAAPAPSV